MTPFNKFILSACVSFFSAGPSRCQASNSGPTLPTNKDAIARIWNISQSMTDPKMKRALLFIFSDLGAACQRKQIRRVPRVHGKNGIGETLGDDGKHGGDGGVLVHGWGPKQEIHISDDELREQRESLDLICDDDQMSPADKACFILDLLVLTLIHEWVHVWQNGTFAEQRRLECEAYTVQCFLAGLYLTEVPKYTGAQKDCTLADAMHGLKEEKCEKANDFCGG